MSNFTYIIAEGVLDVVLLTQVLRRGYGFTVVDKKSLLTWEASAWLDNIKWPVGEDITRRAVPAPTILTQAGMIVGLQNGQGFTAIARKAKEDEERFLRIPWKPSAWAAILDADDVPPLNRLSEFAALAAELGYPKPTDLGVVVESDERRSGIFAFPGQSLPGTIEDVLLPMAATRFPSLIKHGDKYVADWQLTAEAKDADDFKELRKPSGSKKARLSVLAALLKPGKPLHASVEDQKWVPTNPRNCDALKPLIAFLDQLLTPNIGDSL